MSTSGRYVFHKWAYLPSGKSDCGGTLGRCDSSSSSDDVVVGASVGAGYGDGSVEGGGAGVRSYLRGDSLSRNFRREGSRLRIDSPSDWLGQIFSTSQFILLKPTCSHFDFQIRIFRAKVWTYCVSVAQCSLMSSRAELYVVLGKLARFLRFVGHPSRRPPAASKSLGLVLGLCGKTFSVLRSSSIREIFEFLGN